MSRCAILMKRPGASSQIPSLSSSHALRIPALTLSYPKHLGATFGTCTPGRWLAVLHSNRFGIIHLPLGSAFNTICLHSVNLLLQYLVSTINYFLP